MNNHTLVHIAVGSLNPVKVNAVRRALAQAHIPADVQAIAVPSGVADMPIGYAEMAQGARQRAHNAGIQLGTDWGVGLEGGVEFDESGAAWLYSVVAIVDLVAQRESLARGGQILVPPRFAAQLRAGNELGMLMDELLGISNIKQGQGAIGYLTNGLITRESALHDVFCRALAPLIHPELYALSNK